MRGSTRQRRIPGWAPPRLCCSSDARKHPAEHEVMDRAEDVPIRQADVPGGIKHRGLSDLRGLRAIGADLELKPKLPRDLHLGSEAQQAVVFKALDTPEVDRVSCSKVNRVPPASPQPDAASDRVQQSPYLPEPVARVPTDVTADPLDRVKRAA